MSVGKYLTHVGVLGSLAAAIGAARRARQLPKDWRRYLIWAIWAAGVVLAVAGVAKQEQDQRYQTETMTKRGSSFTR